MKESDIQKKIIEYLSTIAAHHGLFFFSIPNESLMQALMMFKVPKETSYKLVSHFKKLGLIPGIPDLCILWNGKTIFIEVKKPGEVPNEKQCRIMKSIIHTGHQVYIIDCLEDLKAILIGEGLKL